jgi:uncharacterized iron-regulated membrane protein
MLRRTLFWLHLTAGVLAGAVIVIMSLTGVLLAWQRQIIRLADRRLQLPAAASQGPLKSPPELTEKAMGWRQATPGTLTMRSDPSEPASIEFGRDAVVYLDPSSAVVLGEGSMPVRRFFRQVEDWHRWLAAGVESRATARGITGACNLIFLGLLLSGAYLWLPRTRQQLRSAIWFRRGVRGKARDWNWHTAIGVWCLLPLLIVVASGVVMSYPWANNLVYRVTGNEPPKPGAGRGGGRGPADRGDTAQSRDIPLAGIDAAWNRAEAQVPGWKSIALRIPANAGAPLVFSIDQGDGGRPDLRSQLTLRRRDAAVLQWEPFSANNAGRRLRSWIRFSHTGESAGLAGQTIAALASLGAVFLGWTGISLAIRRMLAAVARRRKPVAAMEVPAR